jgi:transcriptional regulator with XRE-family HTH domain
MAKKARGLTKSLHSPEYAALCEMLVAARHKAGLTQHDIAKRLRRPQSFIAKYEGGERRLDLIEFVEVAIALESDPIEIFRTFLTRSSIRR